MSGARSSRCCSQRPASDLCCESDNRVSAAGVDARGAAEAVNAIVEDTTQCKFEATSPASDEVVLFNILQVLTWPAATYIYSCARLTCS